MKKPVIILLHIGYWLMYFLLISTFLAAMPHNGRSLAKDLMQFFIAPLLIFSILPGLVGFYSFYTFLFNRFLHKKRIAALFVWGLAICIISGISISLILSIQFGLPGLHNGKTAEVIAITTFLALLTLIHGIIGLVMKGFITWYAEIKLKEDLNKKNYEMELALVKSQISPHFLFNTINNIDVLIEKDAGKASVYLNKLSDIMRFMLYETKTEKIPLAKEITYIEKYIDLQKIRSSNPDYVRYKAEGNMQHVLVEPMLFIPFIENAFKHGESKKKEQAIDIHFTITPNKIVFECSNKYQPESQQQQAFGGLGNDLIKKRLQLLYPDAHQLKISIENNIYSVQLILDNHAN